MAQSERGGPVGLASAGAIGSVGISLAGISLVAGAIASTWGCFDVPTVGSIGFLYADLCLRKVAPI